MDYDKVIEMINSKNDFHKHCGIVVTNLWGGHCEVQAEITPQVNNRIGMAHGGFVFTLADVAAGVAAYSRGEVCVTQTSSINYIRPGLGSKLRAIADEVSRGKKTGVYKVDVVNDQGKLVATATFTMFSTGQPVVEA